jgi:dynein heavy chain
MTDVMSMMFEPMDLLVASPATVSRCGMIYMEPEQLGWKPLLSAWFESNRNGGDFFDNIGEDEHFHREFVLFDDDVLVIQSLFDWLVDPCLSYVRKEGIEMSPTVDANLIMSLLNILEALLGISMKKYRNAETGLDEEISDAKLLKQRQQDLECCFFFALVWSIGRSGTAASQTKFSSFLEALLGNVDCIETEFAGVWNALQVRKWVKPDFHNTRVKGVLSFPMPMRTDFYECCYVAAESKWKTWADLLPAFQIPADAQYSSIVVPNNYTSQITFMCTLLIPHYKNVLVCGPTGTGKSVYIFNTITTNLPQDKYKPLTLGFSAKTSANMTQDIIDGKLDKRRKGVFGPPMGQHSVIFVDDLNMPEVETYGAQPPIELVRQLIDNGGWYDLKEKSWRTIVDTSVISAMGPAGGGRNSVTPRLLRHFNLFCFGEFDDNSLKRIFSTIVQWHFSRLPFSGEVRNLTEAIVDATLDTYRSSMATLLPTPQKSHYTFNLRDFSRIIQGVLLCKPAENFTKQSLVRLWCHEALRVIGDRLIDDSDRQWFHDHLGVMCSTKFNIGFYDAFKHLDSENKKSVTFNEMRNCMWGDYMTAEDPKPYVEMLDLPELYTKMEEYLSEYNQQSKKPMDLVMFSFAIEHISRISRILKMPGGNALLVGVGGSGRLYVWI